MEYNTQQFTQHVRNFIERGYTGQALEVMVNCLPHNNLFYTEILTLQNQFNALKRQEYLGLDADRMRIREIGYATAEYLLYIEKHYYPKIDLHAFPSTNKLQSQNINRKKRKSSTSKKQTIPVMARNAVAQTKSHVKNLFMYLGILLVFGLIIYVNYFKEGPSAEVKTSIGEVLFLDQFERFDEADEQKKKYAKSRWFRVSILKVIGEPLPYKIIIIENANLSNTMAEAKKVWPNARYLDFSKKCRSIPYDESLQCYRCDQ